MISAATRIQLQQEGINNVGDLVDFDKYTFKKVANNLRRPGGRIPDPDPNSSTGATIPMPPFTFGVKLQMRLLASYDLLHYYETVGLEIVTGNTCWDPVIKNFVEQLKSLSNRITEGVYVLNFLNTLSVIKWMEYFADLLNRRIVVRTIPLSNVTREQVTVSVEAALLDTNLSHSTENGLLEEELVSR